MTESLRLILILNIFMFDEDLIRKTMSETERKQHEGGQKEEEIEMKSNLSVESKAEDWRKKNRRWKRRYGRGEQIICRI